MSGAILELEAEITPRRAPSTQTPAMSFEPGRWRCMIILLGWCAVLFLYGLDGGELYRTENLRAIVAQEMLQSGNWVVPTLYGEPLLTKPPGMYALIALVSLPVAHVTAVTARLPSAFAATAVVFLFYWYVGRQLGRLGGLVAGLVLPASLLWLDRAPSAEIDMVQTAWVAGSILFMLRALEEENMLVAHRPFGWWLLALLCVAGGFLTKWTAPAFFYLTAIPLLSWRRQLRLLFQLPHLLGLGLAALLCLAWIAAVVHLNGWETFRHAVEQEALPRLSPAEHQRAYPWAEVLLHPLSLLLGCLPWSACAFWSLKPGFKKNLDSRGRNLWQAFHCWAWPSLVFWSIVPGHHVRHSLPLVPAIMGLAAMVWTAWIRGQLVWNAGWLRPRFALAILLLGWLVVKLAFVQVVLPARDEGRWPAAKGLELARLVPEGNVLTICHVKDEGILFYYGRPVRRTHHLSSPGTASYCLLTTSEWQSWPPDQPVELLASLHDEQGALLRLVRCWPVKCGNDH